MCLKSKPISSSVSVCECVFRILATDFLSTDSFLLSVRPYSFTLESILKENRQRHGFSEFVVDLAIVSISHVFPSHLGSEQTRQVDLRYHLAAAVALSLVCMVVVLHQVPEFGSALQIRSYHGRPGAQAVWTAGGSEHALCVVRHIDI